MPSPIRDRSHIYYSRSAHADTVKPPPTRERIFGICGCGPVRSARAGAALVLYRTWNDMIRRMSNPTHYGFVSRDRRRGAPGPRSPRRRPTARHALLSHFCDLHRKTSERWRPPPRTQCPHLADAASCRAAADRSSTLRASSGRVFLAGKG